MTTVASIPVPVAALAAGATPEGQTGESGWASLRTGLPEKANASSPFGLAVGLEDGLEDGTAVQGKQPPFQSDLRGQWRQELAQQRAKLAGQDGNRDESAGALEDVESTAEGDRAVATEASKPGNTKPASETQGSANRGLPTRGLPDRGLPERPAAAVPASAALPAAIAPGRAVIRLRAAETQKSGRQPSGAREASVRSSGDDARRASNLHGGKDSQASFSAGMPHLPPLAAALSVPASGGYPGTSAPATGQMFSLSPAAVSPFQLPAGTGNSATQRIALPGSQRQQPRAADALASEMGSLPVSGSNANAQSLWGKSSQTGETLSRSQGKDVGITGASQSAGVSIQSHAGFQAGRTGGVSEPETIEAESGTGLPAIQGLALSHSVSLASMSPTSPTDRHETSHLSVGAAPDIQSPQQGSEPVSELSTLADDGAGSLLAKQGAGSLGAVHPVAHSSSSVEASVSAGISNAGLAAPGRFTASRSPEVVSDPGSSGESIQRLPASSAFAAPSGSVKPAKDADGLPNGPESTQYVSGQLVSGQLSMQDKINDLSPGLLSTSSVLKASPGAVRQQESAQKSVSGKSAAVGITGEPFPALGMAAESSLAGPSLPLGAAREAQSKPVERHEAGAQDSGSLPSSQKSASQASDVVGGLGLRIETSASSVTSAGVVPIAVHDGMDSRTYVHHGGGFAPATSVIDAMDGAAGGAGSPDGKALGAGSVHAGVAPGNGPDTAMRNGSAALEVGYQDPALGFVELRARLSGGAVHASLGTDSAATGATLQGHLTALSDWMHQRATPVESLTVIAAPARDAIKEGAGEWTGEWTGDGLAGRAGTGQGAGSGAGSGTGHGGGYGSGDGTGQGSGHSGGDAFAANERGGFGAPPEARNSAGVNTGGLNTAGLNTTGLNTAGLSADTRIGTSEAEPGASGSSLTWEQGALTVPKLNGTSISVVA